MSSLADLFVEHTPDASETAGDGERSMLASRPAGTPSASSAEPAMVKRLQDAITQKPNGFSEMTGLLKDFEETFPDEGTRFKAALVAAKRQGLTLDRIQQDLDGCHAVLTAEDGDFQTTCEQRIKDDVGGKESQVAEIEEAIRQRQAQIEKLQAEMHELNTQRETAQAAVAEAKQRIESKRSAWAASLAQVRQTITELRDKVSRYGKDK